MDFISFTLFEDKYDSQIKDVDRKGKKAIKQHMPNDMPKIIK